MKSKPLTAFEDTLTSLQSAVDNQRFFVLVSAGIALHYEAVMDVYSECARHLLPLGSKTAMARVRQQELLLLS